MPYTTTTLGQFVTQISEVMDDPGAVYWKSPQIVSTTYEALLAWGAYTNYWRERGSFSLDPTAPKPYYSLNEQLPTLRTRTWTLNQMVIDIQYMLLENPSGIAGTGMTGQVTIASILNAIKVTRNRFVLDTHLPLSVHDASASPPPPQGLVVFDQRSVFVHRASWKDADSGTWQTLWRQDEWAADHGTELWTITPGSPLQFSEASQSPLQLQLIPPAANDGLVETLDVYSLEMDLTNPSSTFDIPDEWVHAVKYGALSYILYGEGQIKDVLRAEYAEQRYQQAVQIAKEARSVIRLTCNGVPLVIDSLFAMDAGTPFWRNQSGRPQMAGVLYDMIVVNPGMPDQAYGMTADVVRTAPLPALDEFMPIGSEDLDEFTDYVTHALTFQCGGTDFKSTFPAYDNFMSSVAGRKGINAAKIQYLTPLFGQPQKEWQQRPDRVEAGR